MKKRDEKQGKLFRLCTALLISLCLTACGSGSAGGAKPESGAAEEKTPETAEQPSEAAEQAAEPAEEFVTGYTGNGITVTAAELEADEYYASVDFAITNESEETLNIDIYPLLINGEILVSDGAFETIAPGETIEVSPLITVDKLKFAGITSVETIQGYLEIKDESYQLVAEPELIGLYAGEGKASEAGHAEHSAEVVYDRDGIKISHLGTYSSPYDKEALFLVSNETEKRLSVGVEDGLIDGKSPEDRIISWDGATLTPGGKGLVSVYVLNGESYEIAEFETADVELMLNTYDSDELWEYLPLHLTENGETIEVAAGEPYDPREKPKTSYTVLNLSASLQTGVEEYLMIYSDQDDTLTGIIDEVRFAKSEGYEEDIYDYVDLETAFPGISECSFVDLVKDEDDEYYYFITVFRDLDDPANARSMHDIGYLQMDHPDAGLRVAASSLVASYESVNAEVMDPAEYEGLGLHTNLMDLQ